MSQPDPFLPRLKSVGSLEGFYDRNCRNPVPFEAIRDGDAELAAQRMHEHVAAMEMHYKKAGEA